MQNSIFKRIVKWIGNIFLIVALIIVTLVLLSKFLPNSGYDLAVIKSGSMEPSIDTGSVSISKKQSTYHDKDIIMFTRPGDQYVTHRIVETVEQGSVTRYRTKGDANEEPDTTLVEKEHIRGKVIFDIPYLGYVALFIWTPLGFVLLILIPATWFIIREIRNIRHVLKEKKDNYRS